MTTTIGVMARSDLHEAAAAVSDLVDWLKRRGVGCILEDATAQLLDRVPSGVDVASGDVIGSVRALVVLGGDGTLLKAAHLVAGEETILVGVNFGSLGFLTEISLPELYPTLEQVLSGRCGFEERRMLRATVRRPDGSSETTDVLNDVVITKAELSRIVELDVTIDGEFVSAFRADGLIVSSPTGSTAYNLAAGGPILHPRLGAVVVTPICPHMLTNRPLAVADGSVIEVRLREGRDVAVRVSFDGQSGADITEDDVVMVSRSPRVLRLAKSPQRGYYEVLRTKLKWGDAPVRRR